MLFILFIRIYFIVNAMVDYKTHNYKISYEVNKNVKHKNT